jgi:hypothetical protein
MKNTITLNIGLLTSESSGKRPLDVRHVLDVVASHGFTNLVTRHAVHASNTEPTLVVELVSRVDLDIVLHAVARLSDYLEQDCIALLVVAEDGTTSGHLVGDRAEAWSPFSPAYFLTLDGRTLAEENARDASLLAELGA